MAIYTLAICTPFDHLKFLPLIIVATGDDFRVGSGLRSVNVAFASGNRKKKLIFALNSSMVGYFHSGYLYTL